MCTNSYRVSISVALGTMFARAFKALYTHLRGWQNYYSKQAVEHSSWKFNFMRTCEDKVFDYRWGSHGMKRQARQFAQTFVWPTSAQSNNAHVSHMT